MATKTAARTAKKSKKASKKLPVCTKKDLRKPKRKRRKCTVPKKTTAKTVASTSRPSPTGPLAAPSPASSHSDAFPTQAISPAVAAAVAADAPTVDPATTITPQDDPTLSPAPALEPTDVVPVVETLLSAATGVPVYAGTFGEQQATRLLFRAGFGPKPGQAAALASLGLEGAVAQLINPGTAALVGPAPSGSFLVNGQLSPDDKWGHLHLSFLDRMIRSTDQLGERMTLILHDWFGVSGTKVEKQEYMRNHLALLRSSWRGSFRATLKGVSSDPAMIVFLDSRINSKTSPNENYARELMELFTLGPDRGAYTETDVKEAARALTGWRSSWAAGIGWTGMTFDATRFDSTSKTLFAGKPYQRSGNLGWRDVIDAICDHPMHPGFVVRKLWSYFVPTAPDAPTQTALELLYRSSGEALAPLVAAILKHPALYTGPTMVKSPAVHTAGMLRARGMGITTDSWVGRMQRAGQMLGDPPNVNGWNDLGWINSSSYRTRYINATEVMKPALVTKASYEGKTETPTQAIAAARAYWANPTISTDLLAALQRIANTSWSATNTQSWPTYAFFLSQRQNTLRQLIGVSPDYQVS